MTTLSELAAGLGFAAAIAWLAKWLWHRLLWRRFEFSISTWAQAEQPLAGDLSSDEWKSLVAIKLSDAGFSPLEIDKLLELGVHVAKGRASLEVRGRIA